MIAPVAPAPDCHGDVEDGDDGAILIMVLVMAVIGSLIVLPLLSYTTSVVRASRVQTAKAEAVELAEGGTWVALSNQGDLFDLCTSGALISSLDDVSTTCDVLETATLRPAADVPFHVSALQADRQVPAPIGNADSYVNPNTAADPAAWRTTPDWSATPAANNVWLPELPVRATSSGGTRRTTMISGQFDEATWGPTCTVFFPGTFNDPIVLTGPTYFTSGVYYFTKPITIASGANVIVGNGTALGCTDDFEAIAGATLVPNPLNMSGLGGTFVLGGDARITIDDSGSGDIRFEMNQRYVAAEETSVAASENVSIVSVNGDHAPFAGTEMLGDDLVVPGAISVPASTVGTAGSPLAASEGYLPSNLSPKVAAPGAPTITGTVSYQRDRSGNTGPADRGRVTVWWDVPVDNGSKITGYTVTDSVSGLTCSPEPPALPDTSIQASCTIKGITTQSVASGLQPIVSVTAMNAAGVGAPSVPVAADRMDLDDGSQVDEADVPDAPGNPIVTNHSDGLAISWDTPDANGSPITGYRVQATNVLDGMVFGCSAWWDETSCVILQSAGLIDSAVYDISVVALQTEGQPPVEFVSPAATILGHTFVAGGTPAPVQIPVLVPSVRSAILDLTTMGSDNVDVSIAGYVSVPQGRINIGAASSATTTVTMIGGVLAGEIVLDAAGVPGVLDVRFDNPIAQKRILLVSTTSGRHVVNSEAVVQVNRSGSIAINSWVVQ